MKEKILYIVIGALVIVQVIDILKPSKELGYEYERDLYNKQQEDIKTLYKDVYNSKAEIIRFKHMLDEVDTAYIDITDAELRKRADALWLEHNK